MDANIKSEILQKFYLQEKVVILASGVQTLDLWPTEARLSLFRCSNTTLQVDSNNKSEILKKFYLPEKGVIIEPGQRPTEAKLSL